MNIIPLQFANSRSAASATAAFDHKRPSVISTGILAGIAIVALVPAIFWTCLIWGVSHTFDLGLTTLTLATLATAIAAFLSIVCSAVIAAG